ncbi:MAG: helix-turn-helix transcriptional regulator [Clostridia bacterium]|nr:helix-turn-helix transcriptional regulator [Clostridia bacterium]
MIREADHLNDVEFEILRSSYLENINMPQMHYHSHYEILYIYENSRILTCGEKEYVLDKDHIVLIPPFIPHLTISGGVVPQRRIIINFSESFLHDLRKTLPEDILSCMGAPCSVIAVKDFYNSFISIINEINPETDKNEQILQICRLLNLLSNNSEKKPDNLTDNIVRYVEANFSEKITLDFLAEKFFLSKFTLSRRFSAYTGTSLPKYLSSIRIINAKRYLKEGMKVTDVAFKCGFESTTNFDRVFLSQTGMSPSAYKKTL